MLEHELRHVRGQRVLIACTVSLPECAMFTQGTTIRAFRPGERDMCEQDSWIWAVVCSDSVAAWQP